MTNWKWIIGLVVVAGLLALFGYLIINTFFSNGDEAASVETSAPNGVATEVVVEGIPVVVVPDPNQEAELQSEAAAPAPVTVTEPAPEQATASPTEALPDAEIVPPQPSDSSAEAATAATPTFTPPAPSPLIATPLPGTEPQFITVPYVVVAGDNLYRVAEKHNSRVSLLAAYNIDQADIIVGAPLSVPIANPQYCGAQLEHIVGEGETAASIAGQYGISLQSLALANGLNANYTVRFNTVLCIP
ncbi:MAG: LysM peptidoglycan-binding domain-containing protein [Anaerolineae bacterium]|nr:LysM peptidoglycan-binding domain-containing protein [Anaerolineae bacterium]